MDSRERSDPSYVGWVKISPQYLAALAVGAISGLNAVGTRAPFNETDDFVTGCVLDSRGRRWIVKCPKHSTAATALETEAGLAPLLLDQLRRGELPFDVIRPAGFSPVPTGGRAMVYPEPFGTSISFDDLSGEDARELGRTIAAIHLLPHGIIRHAGLPSYTAEEYRRRHLAELHDAEQVSHIPNVLRRRWEEALENTTLWDFDPVMVHGNIDSENFLWQGTEIASVQGFGEAHVGDPATDLVNLLELDEDILDALIESYQNTRSKHLDEHCLTRAYLINELNIVRWLQHGIRTGNADIKRDALEMLSELADSVDADPTLSSGPAWDVDPSGR